MAEYAKRVTVAVAIFFAFVVGLLLVSQIKIVLIVLLIAIMFAAAVRPLVLAIQRDLRISRVIAVLLVYLGLVLIGAIAMVTVVPMLIAEISMILVTLPGLTNELAVEVAASGSLMAQIGQALTLSGQLAELSGVLFGSLNQLVLVPLGIASVLAWGVSIFFLAFYWLLEGETTVEQIVKLVSPSWQGRARRVLVRVEDRLGAYVRGQLLVMGSVGVLALVGLTILGMPYALVLALITALLDVIPIIGPPLAAVPAIIVASFQSPILALLVLGLYIFINQVEGNLIYPRIQARIIHVSALLILLALMIGAELMGILGALIAVPVLVAILVVVDELRHGPRQTTPPDGES